MTTVHAPVGGRVIEMSDISDQVFSEEMMGPGVGIEPSEAVMDVVSPVSGRVAAIHPHAFAVATDQGGVLVHLGIDTVTLRGRGFTVMVRKGQHVNVGDLVVSWDTAAAKEQSLATTVLVIAKDREKGSVESGRVGEDLVPGDTLFVLD